MVKKLSEPGETRDEIWLSVIIPMYREPAEEQESLFAWARANHQSAIEWIVACAESDEEGLTALKEVISSGQEENVGGPAVTTKANIRVIQSRRGRSAQMNAGASHAQGRTLVFLHADTQLEPGWLDALKRAVELEGAVWGAFSPRIDADSVLFRLAERWGRWRSRVLGFPYGDQALFVDRRLFWRVGGFDEVVQFMEEVDLGRRLGRLGVRPHIVAVQARTSARKWSKWGVWHSARNVVAFACYLAGVPREWIERWYQAP